MTSTIRNAVAILLLAMLGHSSSAIAEWSGGITDETIVGRPFGRLASVNKTYGNTKLNLVCFEEDSVWLYLDKRITNNVPVPNIVMRVDQLPPNNLTFQRKGENYTITNRGPGFWKLIAQMAAGAVLKIDVDGIQHQYNLTGFRKAYQENCGWVNSANNYHTYLAWYQ